VPRRWNEALYLQFRGWSKTVPCAQCSGAGRVDSKSNRTSRENLGDKGSGSREGLFGLPLQSKWGIQVVQLGFQELGTFVEAEFD